MTWSNRPNPRPLPANPRKVRGGVRLAKFEPGGPPFADSWAAQRWLKLLDTHATAAAASEGLQYADQGQARSFSVEPGRAKALVQGRMPRAYDAAIAVRAVADERWQSVIGSMLDQAVYSAKILAGELPATIEDLFVPLGLHLFPRPDDAADVTATCSCLDFRTQPGTWCKHLCCTAYLVADRLATDPFLIFTLRGLPREELLERLRQHRQAAGAGAGGALVYTAHVPGLSDAAPAPLEESLGHFWDSPIAPAPELPIAPPEVSHPLLRRLGPSPFPSGPGKFPLLGLLATCYDVISERVIRREQGDETAAPPPNAEQD